MKTTKLALTIASLTIVGSANAANPWDSVVNSDYLGDMGATVEALTDVENGSRWYAKFRVTSETIFEDGESTDESALHARLKGNTAITDDLSFVGDFWMKAIEKNVFGDTGAETDGFDGFNDNVEWRSYRVGFESQKYGAITYAKHFTTWGPLSVDIGVQGALDAQGDVGMRNSDKILYKNHLENDLFLRGSYDLKSKITGLEIGYQTIDIYGFKPDGMGVYFSAHNGQPLVTLGSKPIVGNVDPRGTIKSDSQFPRASESNITYQLHMHKTFGYTDRLVAGVAYSKMEDTADEILAQGGMTKGGLGLSASLGYQHAPAGFRGISPVIYLTNDEFGSSATAELQYMFGSPMLRVAAAYSYHENTEDLIRLKFFWEF